MSKRLSKEELESDPLIENYNRAANFYVENKVTVLSTIIGLVVLIGGIIGYNYYSGAQESQAQELLAIAEGYYSQGDYENALYGNEFELTYGFDQIADEFPRTNAGNIAIYYAAVSSFELGDVENALNYMESFDIPDGIMGVGPLTFHARLLMANESHEAAAQKFVEAANWDENEVTTPSNLFEAAQAYHKAGNNERANELVTQIIEDYPQSSKFAESQKLKGMIAAN
ncbi:tetratricopeptide repeat protein [Gracilimonas amylolytica]|uniref:tetratricopeptide repeat protein n=1 Tax=Gracilimonas amylolytica TaxID=1749045 RepID=UPI000CD84A32|nr:tetratricopeptide repeat protein [Gracilimonas amylolytica]